jgi:pilus assembly protein Flp/PilA
LRRPRKIRASRVSSFDTSVLHWTPQHTGVAARHEQQRERSLTATAVRSRIAETLALLRRAEGQTMTEYGILLALIAVAVIGVLTTMGGKVAAVFTSVTSAL